MINGCRRPKQGTRNTSHIRVSRAPLEARPRPHEPEKPRATRLEAADLRSVRSTFGPRSDPERAWELWRATRDEMFRTHPQSPLPEGRGAFEGLCPSSTTTPPIVCRRELEPHRRRTTRSARAERTRCRSRDSLTASFEIDGRTLTLEAYWLDAYGGGLFLPFRDATSGKDDLRRGALPTGHGEGSGSRLRRGRTRSSTSTSPTTHRVRTTLGGCVPWRRRRTD